MHSLKYAVLWMNVGPLLNVSVCGKPPLSSLYTLFVASLTGPCVVTWIHFFFVLIHKKTSVHMDYQMFSIKGGVQSYNLCPGNYETPALALGHLGFSSLWGLSRKEGPPVSSPQFSAQMKRGTMCWRNFKEVCVWERPESLEAPWIEREAFFLMWFHGPSWKEWQGLPCHSHFKISHAEPTCSLGKLFLSELVLRCLLHSFIWTCMAQCRLWFN